MDRITRYGDANCFFCLVIASLRVVSASKQSLAEHDIRHPDVMRQNCRPKTKLGIERHHMRLSELLQTQSASKKRLSDGSVPEVFIIESLELIDENKDRREGAVLASILRMCGKKPLYYYIRTKAELELIAKEFEASGYRYLHISCHGNDTCLSTTLDSISYKDFATIFKSRLDKRRLFVSACSTGNELLAQLIETKSPGVLSVAAPVSDIDFDIAVAFWSAFYVKVFDINPKSMNSTRLAEVLKALVSLFETSIHWSWRSKDKNFIHEVIDA